ALLECAGEREHVAYVIVDDQDLAVREPLRDLGWRGELVAGGPAGAERVLQEQSDLVQHGLARRPSLQEQYFREPAQLLLLRAPETLRSVDHERHLGDGFRLDDSLQQLDGTHVAELRTEEHAVVGSAT